MDCKNETFGEYSFIVASCLSFLGGFSVVVVIFTKRLYSCYSFEILLLISANDAIRAIAGILLTSINTSSMCIIYTYIFNSLSVSNAVWASCIARTIYKIVVLEEVNYSINLKKWFLFAYGIPLILFLLPLITESYSNQSGICSFKAGLTGTIWRFGMFYFLIIANLTVILSMSVKIFKKVKIIDNFSSSAIIINRGLIYAIIIAICELPLLIFRIAELFTEDCFVLLMIIICGISFNLQGFYNAVVFFLNTPVREVMRINSEKFGNSDDISCASLKLSYASTVH
jgi:hypothetical protein